MITVCLVFSGCDAFQYHPYEVRFDGDGVMYYGVTCTSDRQYMIFNINKEGYRYEVIDF